MGRLRRKTFRRTAKRLLALTLSVVTIFALGYGVLQTQAYAEDAAGDTFVLTGQGADGASDVTPADAGAAASNQDAAQTDPIPGNSAEQDTGAAASDSLSQQEFTASVYSDDTLTTLTTEHTIHVSGELPAGGYAVAYPVDPSTVDGDVLCAYDITAYCADGTKFEPDADNPLTVSIDMPDLPDGLEADDLGLVYVPADPAQAPESLPTPVAVTDTGVSFEVEHFSTYVVTVVSVSQWSIYLDSGLIAYQRAATPAGTNGTYTGSVTSTYPGQAHSFDLSSTNQNLYFTSVTKDGVEQLPGGLAVSTLGGSAAPFLTVGFTQNTQIIVKYDNRYASGATTSITLTINITVNTPNADIGIQDDLVQTGLLNAIVSSTLAPSVVSYTWYKSSDGVTYTEVTDPLDAQPALYKGPDGIDGGSVNVALDNGAEMYYKVVATLSDNSTVTSDPYQVPYAAQLMNGSFESGNVGSIATAAAASRSVITAETNVPYWYTTADDRMIEIWASGFKPGTPGNIVYNAYEDGGTYFAELNANMEGTLYQDILVTPGSTLTWTLAHAARNIVSTANPNGDTMNVVIMPTSQVPVNITSDQAKAITQSLDGSTQVTTITDTNGVTGSPTAANPATLQWNSNNGGKEYSGDYVVPDGVYVVRFFFVSVVSNATAQGNLLDGVTFKSDLPYSVEYYVNGVLQDADTENGTASANTRITASNTGDFSTYTLQRSVLVNKSATGDILPGSTDLKRGTSFTLTKGNTVMQLYYVTQGIFVNKEVDGLLDPGDMPTSTPYTATFGLYDAGDNLLSMATVTMTNGDTTGSMQFFESDGVTPFALAASTTYTIKELSYGDLMDAGYSWKETIPAEVTSVDSSSETPLTSTLSSATKSMTFTTPPPAQATPVYEAYFTNTYVKNTTLTVSKEVAGEYADMTKPFTFTATFLENGAPLTGDISYTGGVLPGLVATAPLPRTVHLDSSGSAAFTLSHGQLITITNIPPDCSVQIEEDADGYNASFIDNDDPGTKGQTYDTGPLSMSQDRDIAFTNTFRDVVATGVDTGDDGSFLLLCGAALVIALTLVLRIAVFRRRKRAGDDAL